MEKKTTISDSEWKIMKLLWRKSPQPAYDLAKNLTEENMSQRMVKTLLNRLLQKGILKFEQYKNLYLYSPAVSEKECVKAESASFLRRVFDGSVSTMMVHFTEHEKLSKKEIQELESLRQQVAAL